MQPQPTLTLLKGGALGRGKMTPPFSEMLSFCVAASVLVSGGFDRTVAIWDVGEGYRKLSLKVPMSASDRGSMLGAWCWVLGIQ